MLQKRFWINYGKYMKPNPSSPNKECCEKCGGKTLKDKNCNCVGCMCNCGHSKETKVKIECKCELPKEEVSKLTCKHGTFTTYGWGDKMECSECRPQESHKESWEEEFDEEWSDAADPTPNRKQRIKRFIEKLLKEAHHSLILELEEKVEGMKKEIYCQFPCSTCREPRAYNSALQEVLQVIRELK